MKVCKVVASRLRLAMYGATKGVKGIAFGPDGKHLITISDVGNL